MIAGTIVTYTYDGIAEILINPAATTEHVLDTMDLARMLIAQGVTSAKIIKSKPVTGEPAINIAHATKGINAMSKPELKPVKPEAEADPLIEAISTPAPPDPFDLEKLRLDQNFVESAGVKKLLTKVPVQKPDPQSFIRVHPDEKYRMALAVIMLKEDSETFLLTPNIARELPGEFVMVMMYTAITRQGTLFLWPVRLPDADGKINEWHRSAAYAAEFAMKHWVRVKANKAIRGYDLIVPDRQNPIPDPDLSDLISFQELLRIAFRDGLVDRLDHAVVKRLRGA